MSRRVWEAGTWRFPYAHEVGHWLTDRGHDDFARCTSASPRGQRRQPERVASDFAGVLLVPEREVQTVWDAAPGLDVVAIGGRLVGVAATAALRVLQMTKAPRAVALSQGGRVEWWAETAAFDGAGAGGARGAAGVRGGAVARGAGRGKGDAGRGADWDSAVKVGEGDVVVSWLG